MVRILSPCGPGSRGRNVRNASSAHDWKTLAEVGGISTRATQPDEACHVAYSTIYAELGEHFHVARYTDIPEAQWQAVMSWFQIRLR